ncbi:MAG: Flp family type IVb pilin [Acidimicrobiia bacterium]
MQNRDRGATMVEYGLIVGVISLMSLSAVTLLGDSTGESFDQVTEALDNGSAGGSGGSGGEDDGSGGNGGSGATTTTTTPSTTTTTAAPTTTTTAPTTTTTISPNGTLKTGSASATLTSWKRNKGDWTASVEYSNDWEYDQYLTLVITETNHKGQTKTITVEDFRVPAGGSATFDHEDNDLRKWRKDYTGVLEVEVEVVSVTTTNQNSDEVTYDVEGETAKISAPTP